MTKPTEFESNSEENKQSTYVKSLTKQLRYEIDHNETLLSYIRFLNAQVSGNTHLITDLQHKIAKALKEQNDKTT